MSVDSIIGVTLSRPLQMEPAESLGMRLYCCIPLGPDGSPTHYLAVLACPGWMHSAEVYEYLAEAGVLSCQWLTYQESE